MISSRFKRRNAPRDEASAEPLPQSLFYSNSYSSLAEQTASPPAAGTTHAGESSRSRSLKHKTSMLLKKTAISRDAAHASSLSDRFSRIKSPSCGPSSPFSPSINAAKVQISGPQNFQHLFHMDTSSDDPHAVHAQPDAEPHNAYKPSPSSMSSSLFSEDYFSSGQYPGTPSSPISEGAPNLSNCDKKLSEKSSLSNLHVTKKPSCASTNRTSLTNSASSVFDKSNTSRRSEGLRSSSFSSNIGSSEAQKYLIDATIPENSTANNLNGTVSRSSSSNSSFLELPTHPYEVSAEAADTQEPSSILDTQNRSENVVLQNPFTGEPAPGKNVKGLSIQNPNSSQTSQKERIPQTVTRSRQNSSSSLLSQESSLSTASRRLLQSDSMFENSESVLKRNKFLNESTPVPKFTPPAIPASPAHTSHSEDSAQTIKCDQVMKEECISPVSNTASYITPKINDFFHSTNTSAAQGANTINNQIIAEDFNPGQFQRPELHSIPSLKSLKKSKSFLSLKKTFNKHFQTTGLSKKMQFKNSNESLSSLGSDKSLTRFSPELETNNISGRPLSIDTKNHSGCQTDKVQIKDLMSPVATNDNSRNCVSDIVENEAMSGNMLKHFSFEKSNPGSGNSFDVDFDTEVPNKEVEDIVGELQFRSRHNTVTSRQSSHFQTSSQQDASMSSNVSAFSYNTTKPTSAELSGKSDEYNSYRSSEPSAEVTNTNASAAKENRRSSIYIRQSWLKDEALAIFKDTDFVTSPQSQQHMPTSSVSSDINKEQKDLSNLPSPKDSVIAEEEGILPLSPSANKKQTVTNLKLLNNSYDNFIVGKTVFGTLHDKQNYSAVDLATANVEKELNTIEDELEAFQPASKNDSLSFFMRRRSENDLSNIAMLELEQEIEKFSEGSGSNAEEEQEAAAATAGEDKEVEKSFALDSDPDVGSAFSQPNTTATRKSKNLHRLTLHTPAYLVDFSKNSSPSNASFSLPNDNVSPLVSASVRSTMFLATPNKKFGHGKSHSIASSVYSNGTGGCHSRSSSFYNNEGLKMSNDDFAALLRPKPIEVPKSLASPMGDSANVASKKKLTVDRNSYIQFNFDRFEDFKMESKRVGE